MKNQALNHYGNGTYLIRYQIAFKVRESSICLTPQIVEEIRENIERLLFKHRCQLDEFESKDRRISFLISAHPKFTPAPVIANLKTVTARLIKKKYTCSREAAFEGFWENDYLVLSIGNQKAVGEID